MLIVHGLHRIGKVDVANIEGLERMDRMDIGIERPRLHLQMRTATLRDVAHPADDEISTAIRLMEGGCQRLMAVVAAIRNLRDRAGRSHRQRHWRPGQRFAKER